MHASADHPAEVAYRVGPPLSDEALNALYAAAWPSHQTGGFGEVLGRSLAYVCAYAGEGGELIGFVYLAWDGGIHAFVLDTTVHPAWQRRGIGRELVERAAAAAKERGVEWVHVDYDPHLHEFYTRCGFRPTMAGLRNLRGEGGG